MPPRFAGNVTELADIIRPFAIVPDWLKYGEKLTNSTLEIGKIVAHKAMWQKLKAFHPRLTFAQGDMEKALRLVGASPPAGWQRALSDDELTSFANGMALRLRTQARHITQAAVKNPNTGWLAKLWATEAPADKLEKKEATAASTVLEQQEEEKSDADEEEAEEAAEEEDEEEEEEADAASYADL